jgi:hypothetical protein
MTFWIVGWLIWLLDKVKTPELEMDFDTEVEKLHVDDIGL